MRADVPELLFSSRKDFRAWLRKNAASSEGVWLIFGKTKTVVTVTANDALEEALCFGWIDGQMRRVDDTKYHKYFARRRAKSIWSAKNKKTVDALREKGLMTELGEKAIETAKTNGMWDARPDSVADEQELVEAFAKKLAGFSPAHENFQKMSPSAKRAQTRRHLSFKTEEARQRDFLKIIDMLNAM